jgi:hypothetical protein
MIMWCVVVLRTLACTDQDGKRVDVDDVVTVYGPFTKGQAHLRADKFNDAHDEEPDGRPVYRPVPNAPAFLSQENWVEHHAVVCPLNDVTW